MSNITELFDMVLLLIGKHEESKNVSWEEACDMAEQLLKRIEDEQI
jgi:hypothetical protein